MSKGFLRLMDSLYLTCEQCQEICIYAHRVCSTGSMLLCSTRAVPAVNTCNCQCTSGMKEVDCIATRYTRHGIHMMWVCVCGRVPCSHPCRCRSEAQGASTSRFGCRWCHSNYNIHVEHQQVFQRNVDYNNKPRHVTVDVIRVQTRTHMHISCVFQFTSDRFMRNHGLHFSEVLSTTIRQGM